VNNSSDRPYFTVHLEAPEKHFSWCIAMNGKVIHHIAHFRDFAKDVGYPDLSSNVLDGKTDFDKVMEFTQNGDADSDICEQYKITEYLYKNCEQFKNEYGDFYASVIQACKLRFDKSSSKCANCLMQNEAIL
jgi:hypothetical protein